MPAFIRDEPVTTSAPTIGVMAISASLAIGLSGLQLIAPVVAPNDFDFESATITTTVNGEIRQQAKLEQMIFKPYNIIAFLSTYMTLQEGDIIFTGTPSGVVLGKNESKYSWLKPGDIVTVSISGIGTLENKFI